MQGILRHSSLALAVLGQLASALQLNQDLLPEPGPFIEKPVEFPTNNEPVAQKIVLHDSAVRKSARCLDGTPAAYYYLAGTGDGINKWLIHHEGGGWCTSYDSCLQRSKTALGSSADTYRAPQEAIGSAYRSSDPAVNPQMHNWNKVRLIYCDGGSFSGTKRDPTSHKGSDLYFSGFFNLNAIIDDLATSRGLFNGTDFVIGGASAGGLATYMHLDHWASRLPITAKVVGLPDSGYFLEYEGPKQYRTGLQWVHEAMQSKSNLACISSHSPLHAWKCMFAQHLVPHIRTPLFALQPRIDSWQIDNELVADKEDARAINWFGALCTQSFIDTVFRRGGVHGGALDSCFHHGYTDETWQNMDIDGFSPARAFEVYYKTGEGRRIQIQPYPCDSCCSKPTQDFP